MPPLQNTRGTSIALVPRFVCTHAAALVIIASLIGCSTRRSTAPSTSDADYRDDLQASIAPPTDWRAQPVDEGTNYVTQVWVSPSGDTALGVIRFTLPLPVGHEWALWGFLQNMRKSEGRAELVDKQWDDSIGALRFVAEGGRYRVRSILYVDGLRGWSVFAGTLTERAINEAELSQASTARDAARIAK